MSAAGEGRRDATEEENREIKSSLVKRIIEKNKKIPTGI